MFIAKTSPQSTDTNQWSIHDGYLIFRYKWRIAIFSSVPKDYIPQWTMYSVMNYVFLNFHSNIKPPFSVWITALSHDIPFCLASIMSSSWLFIKVAWHWQYLRIIGYLCRQTITKNGLTRPSWWYHKLPPLLSFLTWRCIMRMSHSIKVTFQKEQCPKTIQVFWFHRWIHSLMWQKNFFWMKIPRRAAQQ